MSKYYDLLNNWISNPNLQKHCFAVESCMRYYARILNLSDKEIEDWGIAGLLHDLDWEKYPDEHPNKIPEILREYDISEEIIDAILGHAYPDRTNTPRTSLMAKYLFACDELSGFIVAYALMKPNKLLDVNGEGVKKKLKDKAFARGVNRDDIYKALEEIGLGIVNHAENLIKAMHEDKRLGLS